MTEKCHTVRRLNRTRQHIMYFINLSSCFKCNPPKPQIDKREYMLHEFTCKWASRSTHKFIKEYSPKGNHYFCTLPLTNLVLVAFGFHSNWNKCFYCTLHNNIGVNITSSLGKYITTKNHNQHLNSIQK